MPYTTRDLLGTGNLLLRALTPESSWDRSLRWCTVTELLDPGPWLAGDELVLTTGLQMRHPEDQVAFASSLSSAGVAAVGFGPGGDIHACVPEALLRACNAAGIAVIEVPRSTPFVAVSQVVCRGILAEFYAKEQRSLEVHEALAGALLAGLGLGGLAKRLRDITHSTVAIMDFRGQMLASAGSLHCLDEVVQGVRLGAGRLAPAEFGDTQVWPILLHEEVGAVLCLHGPITDESRNALRQAATLVGLEVSRTEAVHRGHRELAGQIIDDTVKGRLSDDAAGKQLALFGIQAQRRNQAVVVRTGCTDAQSRLLAWTTACLLLADRPRFMLARDGSSLTLVLDADLDAMSVGQHIQDRVSALRQRCAIGIGSPRVGVSGLRTSLNEASAACLIGDGINEARAVGLTDLILMEQHDGVEEVAASTVAPLLTDEGLESPLLATAAVYFEEKGSIERTAHRLRVHRHTVKHRLGRIEALTGMDSASAKGFLDIWLAVQLLGRTRPTEQDRRSLINDETREATA